jgi:hypothetical protein
VRKSNKEVSDLLQKADMDLLYNRAFKNTFREEDLKVYEIFKEGYEKNDIIIPSVIIETIYADLKGSVSIGEIIELELSEHDVLDIDFTKFYNNID